ncbi:hypothetical protein GQ43DRAFT_484468 [Delitschia confertaspora ATCC 74209]|uniref:Uncharacterized protein n=1 Tax=Delitschia confertaspora ATCC 74209 TaxID=1513339 RepID=A0A9P4MRI4_9PLEO|nr:hypothetical protein GQ43DRAFT_484468 [Delitschia confertaspora ATCC 74209]
MSFTTRTSGDPNLDSLQAMVNLVLTQTGRYIKESKAGGGSHRAQYAMNRAIPAATERFHDSLDELENELSLAQMVLRRDLAIRQTERKKKEQAEAAERQRLAAETSAKSGPPVNKEKEKNLTMVDAHATQSSNKPQSPAPASNVPALAASSNPPPALDTTPTTALSDPLFGPTPTTANAQESVFDFDAMFADHELSTSNHEQNFATDLPPNVTTDSTSTNINYTFDDNSAPSLLRGLEDFASNNTEAPTAQPSTGTDGANDFAILHIPNDTKLASSNSNNQSINANVSVQSTESATAGGNSQQQFEQKTELADQSGNLGDMDLDELLNGDYGNGDGGTQFDDAFFGFGEY